MRTHGWRIGMLSLGLMLALGLPIVGAADTPPGSTTSSKDQVDELMTRYNLHPAFEKLGRGLSNTFGGWLEVPYNIDKHYAPGDTGGSFFTGAAHGLFKGLVRTGVGLYETVTFFLPYPEDYAPILPTLEYFKHTPKRKPLPLE